MKIIGFKKYFTLFFIFVAIATITGCSQDNAANQQAMQQMPPSLVEVITIEQKDVPYIDKYIAQTEGSKAVDVRAQVSGILKERKYVEGQFIEAGAPMFIIEPETYKAALGQAQGSLAQAEANVTQSKLNFDRAQNLYKQNAMSKKDFDAASAAYATARGQLETARSAVANAKIQLGYTTVEAPVSGYTSKSNYSEGNLISSAAALPLTVINQVNPMYVNFSVPANTMSLLRSLAAQKKLRTDELTVKLHFEDGSVYSDIGKVTFFDKQVSSATGDIKVRAVFPNNNLILLPGQFVSAELLGFTLTNAIVIPQKAIMKMADKTMVVTVDDNNIAHYRPIKTSMNLGNEFLVTEGLNPGEKIITEGQIKVREGSPVQIKPSVAPQAAPQGQGQQGQQQATQPAK